MAIDSVGLTLEKVEGARYVPDALASLPYVILRRGGRRSTPAAPDRPSASNKEGEDDDDGDKDENHPCRRGVHARDLPSDKERVPVARHLAPHRSAVDRNPRTGGEARQSVPPKGTRFLQALVVGKRVAMGVSQISSFRARSRNSQGYHSAARNLSAS